MRSGEAFTEASVRLGGGRGGVSCVRGAPGLSSGHAYSQLHIDTAHRNYVLTAMDHAMLTMNEGIGGLAMEPTDLDTYALFRKLPLRALMAQLSTIQVRVRA